MSDNRNQKVQTLKHLKNQETIQLRRKYFENTQCSTSEVTLDTSIYKIASKGKERMLSTGCVGKRKAPMTSSRKTGRKKRMERVSIIQLARV